MDRQIRRYIRAKQKLIKLLEEQKQAIIHRAVTRGLDPNVRLKPSGVEWLGEVPEHWESVALKWISKRYAGGTPDKSNETYWDDGDIPWLNSGAVNDEYITEPSSFITKEGFAKSSAKWIPEKALVMALAGQGKTKGMVAQLGIKTTCNQSMAAIIPASIIEPRFLYWWLLNRQLNIFITPHRRSWDA